MEIIQAQLKEGSEEEKLTWLAMYSLKKQEIDLNEKMFEEINLIKDKYDLLKQPVFSNIAAAATGKKVDSLQVSDLFLRGFTLKRWETFLICKTCFHKQKSSSCTYLEKTTYQQCSPER